MCQAFEPHVLIEDDGKSLAAALTFFPSWDQLDKDLLTPYVEGKLKRARASGRARN